MTGDGTNDAPSLKLSDVGMAMQSGSIIAKDSAKIVLANNRLDSIVTGLYWGRNTILSV